MPGRIVGQSIDTEGKTAYTLTLSTPGAKTSADTEPPQIYVQMRP